MEGNNQFVDKLEHALDRYRVHLDQTTLPNIKTKFESFYGTYQNLYNVLLRKSLIKEDPYKGEQKLSEIVLPPDTEVAEVEKNDQIGLRLSQFETQLNFLLSYYQFSVDFLSLSRIKLMASLTRFIGWGNLSPNSSSVNTRLLGELINKVRGGSDTFSIQVINNAQTQLAGLGNEIVHSLKDLTRYHKERYKLEVRRSVIEMLNFNAQVVMADKETALAQVKKKFATSMQGMPFYGELIAELLEEDYGVNASTSQANVLKQLAIAQEKSEKKSKVDFKGLLMEAIRLLSGAGKPIERAFAKLNESSNIVEEYRKKLDSAFRRWLFRFLNRTKEARTYEIDLVDPATAVVKSKTINFDQLIKNGVQTGRLIASYGSKMSAGYARLDTMDEESLYALLERNIIEVQKYVQLLPAIHTYFQDEMDANKRGKLRGVKLEVNAIRNAIVKSNQRRHEYVSRKEEEEQLKKLGMKK